MSVVQSWTFPKVKESAMKLPPSQPVHRLKAAKCKNPEVLKDR